VGFIGSFYKFSVSFGSNHHVSMQTLSGFSYIEIYDDALFTNNICTTTNNSCNITVGATITTLYLKIPPDGNQRETYHTVIRNWEITSSLYNVQLFSTPATSNFTLCGSIQLFYEDAITLVPEFHIIETACSSSNLDATLALESGKTYYLVLYDHSSAVPPTIVDYYALWVGKERYTGTLSTITPEPLINEPSNNTVNGSTDLDIDVIHYDTFTAEGQDSDLFKIVVP